MRSYFSVSVQSKPAKLTFSTECAAKKLPFRVVFRNENLPDCWKAANRSSYGWKVATFDDANYFMRFNSRSNYLVDTLLLPAVNLTEDAILKMEMSNTTGLNVRLMISTDGGATRSLVEDLSTATKEDEVIEKVIDLSAFRGEVNLYFYATGDTKSHYFDFSTLQIVAKPCSDPRGLVANPSSTGAVVTWEAGGSESAWNLRYKATGTSSWTNVTDLDETTYTLSDLTAGTQYEVQVQAACAEDKLSGWTSATFTPECPVPAHLSFPTIDATAAVASWESAETAFLLQFRAAGGEWSEAVSVNAKKYSLSGLTAATQYEVKVQSACGSEFATGRFTTRCASLDATELPFSENFEKVEVDALPECWFVLPDDAPVGVMAMNDDANHKLYVQGEIECWIALPAFEPADLEEYSLVFDYSGICQLEIGYLKAANSAKFVALQQVSSSPAQCDLKSLPAAAQYVAIHYVGSNNWSSAYIDNVHIVESSTITAVDATDNQLTSRKRIIDGALIIEHGGQRYNAQGVIIR